MNLALRLAAMAQQPSSPIIVKIVEPKEDSLYDVMVGALGLTGVMVLAALVAALVFGGVLFWVRSRATAESPPSSDL